jgi:dihydrodipicolinate synthase/N-acetylneuraminate lyase
MADEKKKRKAFVKSFLPSNIPRLWCPLLTHYRDDGAIDFDRMSAHLRFVLPWVKGYLIPGSTGDGWELDDRETLEVVNFALRKSREHEMYLLLGVLKTDLGLMNGTLEGMIGALKGVSGKADVAGLLQKARVCGFTVCPPKGKTLSQEDIYSALSEIMQRGLPTALYQLPQVTENEVSPETFERLVAAYPNLIFFKDSSGGDRIALSSAEKGGVYLVRGAEGDYARWLKDTGGPYDGFLLSTANCFPEQLHEVIKKIEAGDIPSASKISEKISGVVREVFSLVQSIPHGNAFTNANKAIDHYMAFGTEAAKKPSPMLHAKVRLPHGVIAATGEALKRYELMPPKGYLE